MNRILDNLKAGRKFCFSFCNFKKSGVLLFSVASIILISVSFLVLGSCKTTDSSSKTEKLDFRGADVSYLSKMENAGVKFCVDGKEKELLEILKSADVNWIRLRLWASPSDNDSYASLQNVVKMAQRVKAAGFKFLLDIHYSDSWADPSKQTVPAGFGTCSTIEELCQSAFDYTVSIIEEFNSAGCVPDMIQTGNEISNGMLWPLGDIRDETVAAQSGYKNLFTILNTVSSILKSAWSDTKLMIHLDCGGDIEKSKNWFTQAEKYGLKSQNYDVIGLSYYTFFHGKDLNVLAQNIEKLKTQTGKAVVVAETQYPWTFSWADNVNNMVGEGAVICDNIPATPEGQQKYLSELCRIVKNAGGCGVFYWEPAAVADTNFGSDLENLTWFDFNHNWLGTGF